jgi:hypothetical protein
LIGQTNEALASTFIGVEDGIKPMRDGIVYEEMLRGSVRPIDDFGYREATVYIDERMVV